MHLWFMRCLIRLNLLCFSKSRNISNFAAKQGTGLNTLVPISVTESARDVLKQMLIYDPDQRINIRRLSDHRYFQDYK